MLVQHIQNNSYTEKEVTQPVALFLRGATSWFSQFTTRQTRYEGWFLADESKLPHTFFKILERLEIAPHTPEKMIVQSGSAQLQWPNINAALFSTGTSGLAVALDTPRDITLTLDMRGIYLTPEMGRVYTCTPEADGLLITYHDATLTHPLFLHLRGFTPLANLEGSWQLQEYPRDTARNSPPTKLFTYQLPPFKVQRLNFGCGLSRETALAESLIAEKTPVPSFTPGKATKEQEIAEYCAANALANLTTPQGIYAGLPWFHQFWTRDELITGLGLTPREQVLLIERYLRTPLLEGELPTYAGATTCCADGVGWLALLIREHGLSALSPDLQAMISSFLQSVVRQLGQHRRTPSGLIYSAPNATWMDTLDRSGFRLEIQCMYALCLELLHEITGDAETKKSWQVMLDTIRHYFFLDGRFIDGLAADIQPDYQIRPNIFLAYLLQPKLASSAEWETCFTRCLPHLQASWGGLTSLDKEDPVFQNVSTGENNLSYHQGDSWFFMNNLAALALRRCNAKKFASVIDGLVAASTHEILWQHFLGMPGEIAAAGDGESWGCGVQAFSAGTYMKNTQKN